MSRPLFVYVKQAHVAAVPGLAEFVQEFVSDRAAGPDGYLAGKGLTPLPGAVRKAERAKVRALAVLRRWAARPAVLSKRGRRSVY